MTGKFQHLQWVKDNEYSVVLPITDDQKAVFRRELTEEIESIGFVHEKVKSFVRGMLWCEIVCFTLYATPTNVYVVPRDYFIYFIYDCRNSPYSAADGKLIQCGTQSTTLYAIDAASRLIDSLLGANGFKNLDL